MNDKPHPIELPPILIPEQPKPKIKKGAYVKKKKADSGYSYTITYGTYELDFSK
jgi:hypothetical protein